MNVLITGSTGFLGGAMNKFLDGSKDRIITSSRKLAPKYNFCHEHVYGDLTNRSEAKRVVDYSKPDIVFHFAGNALVKIDEEHPNKLIADNVFSTHNLLRELEKQGKNPKLIFSSSVTVFGDYPASSTTTPNPKSLYAVTKLACENLINMYTASGAIRGLSVRLPALVGLWNTHGLVCDLLKKLSDGNESITLLGNCPGSIKPFVHVDEVCKILWELANDNYVISNFKKSIILGNRDSMSVDEVACAMMSIIQEKEIKWSGETWKQDNPFISLCPDIRPPSDSYESIVKVAKEWKKINDKNP